MESNGQPNWYDSLPFYEYDVQYIEEPFENIEDSDTDFLDDFFKDPNDESEDSKQPDSFISNNEDFEVLPELSNNNKITKSGKVCNSSILNQKKNCNFLKFNSVSQKSSESLFETQRTNENMLSSKRPNHKEYNKKDILTSNGVEFMNNYYKLLTKGKFNVVRKELIIQYHKRITQINSAIKKIDRESYRKVGLYFNTFAPQQLLILKTLEDLIFRGLLDYEADYIALTSLKKK